MVALYNRLASIDFIDEYELVVVPIILGDGKYLFKDVKMTEMNLIEARYIREWACVASYRPVR